MLCLKSTYEDVVILYSEWGEEYTDFTILYFFYVYERFLGKIKDSPLTNKFQLDGTLRI